MKLRTTLLLSMMALLAGVLALTMGAVVHVIGKSAREQVGHDVLRGVDFVGEVLRERESLLRSEVAVVAGEPRLKAVVATGDVDHATVVGVLSELAEASKADVLLLTDAEGTLRADVLAPDEQGHDLSGNPVVRSALQEGEGAAVWTDEQGVYQVHAHRIAFGTHVVGVLVLGRGIDDRVMQRLARQTGTSSGLLVDGKLVARGGAAGVVETPEFLAKAAGARPDGQLTETSLHGNPVMVIARPLPGYAGEAKVGFAMFASLSERLKPARDLMTVLSGLAVLALVLALGLAVLLAKRLSQPVDKLAQMAAKLADGELSARVEPAGPVEVFGLGESMNGMAKKLQDATQALEEANQGLERKVAERTQELRTRNAAMKTILDNAGQGFLTVGADGVMAPERSAVIRTWFGDSAQGAHLWDLVSKHDATFGEMLEIGWESLSDGFLPLDLCVDQLPQRIMVASSVLSVSYKPVQDIAGELEHMVVVVSDITAELERERLESEQREILEFFLKLMSNPSAVRNFISETRTLVQELEQADPSTNAGILRNIHTIKGNCSLYGLKTIATRCHEVEGRIAERGNKVIARDLAEVAEAFHTLEARIQPLIQGEVTDTVTLAPEEYLAFLEGLRRADVDSELLEGAARWKHEPAEARLSVLAEQAKGLATRRGKPGLEVAVEGNRVRLSKSRWAPFWSSLVHIVRNAVDHGVEPPEDRLAAGKSEHGRLRLNVTQDQDNVTVTIADDGRGINWEKLADKGRALGLPAETERDRTDLLFYDGLSSRDEADELSGRGIGMSAVLEAVSRLDGRIEIESEPGKGTTFVFRFDRVPLTLVPGATNAA
ncbi:MAG: ATP-binding protein [Myxococcales bacterium]|nr:ATP-binding protein [Myxococcales bacterium]